MKDKNLPLDNNTLSLEELTKEANNIIESLESEKDLQNSIDKTCRIQLIHISNY